MGLTEPTTLTGCLCFPRPKCFAVSGTASCFATFATSSSIACHNLMYPCSQERLASKSTFLPRLRLCNLSHGRRIGVGHGKRTKSLLVPLNLAVTVAWSIHRLWSMATSQNIGINSAEMKRKSLLVFSLHVGLGGIPL